MTVVEVVAAVLLLAALPLLAIALRRRLLAREGGTIEMSVRLRSSASRRRWALGLGRFEDDDLRWYRVFSLAHGPRCTWSRAALVVERRREPTRAEALALPSGAIVLECRVADEPVQIALDPSAEPGFLAWLEARPPGATLPS